MTPWKFKRDKKEILIEQLILIYSSRMQVDYLVDTSSLPAAWVDPRRKQKEERRFGLILIKMKIL
jgi:hypothetical protein